MKKGHTHGDDKNRPQSKMLHDKLNIQEYKRMKAPTLIIKNIL